MKEVTERLSSLSVFAECRTTENATKCTWGSMAAKSRHARSLFEMCDWEDKMHRKAIMVKQGEAQLELEPDE